MTKKRDKTERVGLVLNNLFVADKLKRRIKKYSETYWVRDLRKIIAKGGKDVSGGSYDYLYCKDVDELLGREDCIQQMADRLAGLGYAKDAARETQELLETLRQFKNRIDTMKDRLQVVWQAVEWLDSGDITEPKVLEALVKYRT